MARILHILYVVINNSQVGKNEESEMSRRIKFENGVPVNVTSGYLTSSMKDLSRHGDRDLHDSELNTVNVSRVNALEVTNYFNAKRYDRELQEFANATAWLNDY